MQLGGLIQYNFGHPLLFAGYDWYCKSRERIAGFVVPNDAGLFSPVEEQNPTISSQQKVFGGVSYNMVRRDVTLFSQRFSQLGVSCGLHGAAATAASGLGGDFSIGMSFGVKC